MLQGYLKKGVRELLATHIRTVSRALAVWGPSRLMGSHAAAAPCLPWMTANGGLTVLPVYWYPACLHCSREMTSCEVCGGQICPCSPHVCAADALIAGTDDDFEDSPRGGASDDAPMVLVSGTGGSADLCEIRHEMYSKLKTLWTAIPGSFSCLGDHTWARSRYLDQLSRCYTIDEGEDAYRQLGSTQRSL